MAEIEEVKTETTVENAPEKTYKEGGRDGKKPFNKKGGADKRDRAPRREDSEFDKRVVSVRRVAKVVKGGRTLRFSALVVVGDGKGKVGIGIGKGREVSAAIEKAQLIARKNMKNIPIVNGTIPHDTGVIAGGAARSVLELAGISNIVTKIHGSTNNINCVKATMDGLAKLRTKEEIAARRGKAVDEI